MANTTRYKSVLLFGAPGVGKGTQGKLLGQIPGLWHLATGDIFRSLDRHSPLGRKFMEYSTRGELVPNDLTVQVWNEYVAGKIKDGRYAPDRDLMVLDGIPRSVDQAQRLQDQIDVLAIIHLACPNVEEMVQRMKRRAQKENRADDADEKVIRRRFQVYDEETAPVLDFYDARLVREVNATGTPIEVLQQVLNAVVPVYTAHFDNPLGQPC